MEKPFKKHLKLLYDAADRTVNDDGVEHAGYLAFLAMLSFFPALIFLFSISASIGRQQYGADLLAQFYKLLPVDVMNALSPSINEIMSGPPEGLLTIAIIGIIWTASSGVEGVRTILNKIYRVKNPPHFIMRRLFSILQFIAVIFILMIGMFFLAVLPGIVHVLEQKVSRNLDITPLFSTFKILGSSVFMVAAVASGYYILPNIKHSFGKVIPGAALCVIIWLITIKVFTGIITHYTRISALYGGLAGIIITLLFFYVMALIYIYGAEFNYLLEKLHGHEIKEKEKNVKKPELDKKVEEVIEKVKHPLKDKKTKK